MYEIKTNKYVQEKTILVDDMTWKMKAIGAGDELALNQSLRRMKMLEKKLEDGHATESDLDTMDRLEQTIMKSFGQIFTDQTKDNSQVKKWVSETPLAVIQRILEDIKEQSEKNEKEKTDGNAS